MNAPEKFFMADVQAHPDHRSMVIALERDPRIAACVVESENFESIHNHSAYALVRRDRRG